MVAVLRKARIPLSYTNCRVVLLSRAWRAAFPEVVRSRRAPSPDTLQLGARKGEVGDFPSHALQSFFAG